MKNGDHKDVEFFDGFFLNFPYGAIQKLRKAKLWILTAISPCPRNLYVFSILKSYIVTKPLIPPPIKLYVIFE